MSSMHTHKSVVPHTFGVVIAPASTHRSCAGPSAHHPAGCMVSSHKQQPCLTCIIVRVSSLGQVHEQRVHHGEQTAAARRLHISYSVNSVPQCIIAASPPSG